MLVKLSAVCVVYAALCEGRVLGISRLEGLGDSEVVGLLRWG